MSTEALSHMVRAVAFTALAFLASSCGGVINHATGVVLGCAAAIHVVCFVLVVDMGDG